MDENGKAITIKKRVNRRILERVHIKIKKLCKVDFFDERSCVPLKITSKLSKLNTSPLTYAEMDMKTFWVLRVWFQLTVNCRMGELELIGLLRNWPIGRLALNSLRN